MTCRLAAIFAAQRTTMSSFYEIEDRNMLLETKDIPVNLNDRLGQARLRNYAWRITEEVAEALNVLTIADYTDPAYVEEVADALHFLTEFSILAGVDSGDIVTRMTGHIGGDGLSHIFEFAGRLDYQAEPDVYYSWACFIRALGMCVNRLKMRPWKQKHVETDITLFHFELVNVWTMFVSSCLTAGLDADALDAAYHTKKKANAQRVKDGV